MKTYSQYRAEGLAALKGNWCNALVATILVAIILIVLYTPYMWFTLTVDETLLQTDPAVYLKAFAWTYLVLIFGTILIANPIYVGYYYSFKKLKAENDNQIAANTFKEAFGSWGRNVWGMFLMSMFIFFWSLLFIIPGWIKTFSYALTPYILKDYPEMSANQAINLSRKMMKGHKLDLFCLMLTFIGWGILCLFTLGIGYLWMIPYATSTLAAFYIDVKTEYEAKQEI